MLSSWLPLSFQQHVDFLHTSPHLLPTDDKGNPKSAKHQSGVIMFRRSDVSLFLKKTKLTASLVCLVVFKVVYSIPPRIVDFLMFHALSPFSGQQIFHVRKTKMGICLRSIQLLKVVYIFYFNHHFQTQRRHPGPFWGTRKWNFSPSTLG